MDVKLMGFDWKFNSTFNSNDLFTEFDNVYKKQIEDIRSITSTRTPFEDTMNENMLCAKKHKNYWLGVFIRFIDRASFFKLIKEGQNLTIGSQEMSIDEKLVEVNFFVFDENKKRGIYSYYHQSTWLEKFNKYAKQIYQKLNDPKIEEIEDNLIKKLITKKQANSLKRNYDALDTSIIISSEGFEKIVKTMNIVDKISMSFKTDYIKNDGYSPFATEARSQKIEIGISQSSWKNDKKSIIEKIVSVASEKFVKFFTVYGKSSSKNNICDLVAKLNKNYDYFSKKDYFEIYRNINIDLQNLDSILSEENDVFKWIIGNMNKV